MNQRKTRTFLALGFSFLVAGVILLIITLVNSPAETAYAFPELPTKPADSEKTYSVLTGEAIETASANSAPTFCIQIPNGTDGARPQAGLNEAGVVFEAIAERGITRFASIFQNPQSSIIGPIRSLRTYYLAWDTPFDCTIVHAGGAADALQQVSNGYKNLDENYEYMYRGTVSSRLWNNLFTTTSYLENWAENYQTSTPVGFARLTPEESEKSRINATVSEKLNITSPASGDTSATAPIITNIYLNLGWNYASYNPEFRYNAETNTYDRYYATGDAHEVYACPAGDLGEINPESACSLTQLSPSVVVALVVNEKTASDNYHEDITATGSGKAYIFQNGTVIEATWQKPTKNDQISFTDVAGNEVKLAPGQTWLTAVPTYGSVDYE